MGKEPGSELIVKKWFEAAGWETDKAWVSRGIYDIVAWLVKRGGFERKLMQVKTNGGHSKPYQRTPFFEQPDYIFAASKKERLWIIRWTTPEKRGTVEVFTDVRKSRVFTQREIRDNPRGTLRDALRG